MANEPAYFMIRRIRPDGATVGYVRSFEARTKADYWESYDDELGDTCGHQHADWADAHACAERPLAGEPTAVYMEG